MKNIKKVLSKTGQKLNGLLMLLDTNIHFKLDIKFEKPTKQ